MVRIAVDAMGSDRAPRPEVEGALAALAEVPEGRMEVLLVGPEKRLREELTHLGAGSVHGLRIVHAPQWVTMEDKPSEAVKAKPQSSIAVALELQKNGEADALVSAGNTGAVMAFSLLKLGRLPGIRRPAITAIMPTVRGFCLFLDVGANVDCKPEHLLQFAYMGAAFSRFVLGRENPTVGLLTIGAEEKKGNDLVLKARELLENAPNLNFAGHVEGHDLPYGKVDVFVTDGFVGNVVLKFGEGIVEALTDMVRQEFRKRPYAVIGIPLIKPVLRAVRDRLDFEEYGGAPLLGINGVVIIAHGRSSGRALKNAIRMASRFHENRVNDHIREMIGALSHGPVSR